MKKQSNYWHLSNTDLVNLGNSVYELTSNFDKFGIVKREYNNLRKFSGIPAVSDLLKHSELVYGKKNLIGKIKEFENSPTDKFFHVGLDELDSYVVENISE